MKTLIILDVVAVVAVAGFGLSTSDESATVPESATVTGLISKKDNF